MNSTNPDYQIPRSGLRRRMIRNGELQFYTRNRTENARVEKGTLIIESRQEKFPNPAYQPDARNDRKRSRPFAEYTSASLTTRGISTWRYGRIEVRAKIPRGRGMWPAIWMLGADRSAGWPACGEIDIMEYVGFEPDTIHGTVHCAKYNHIKKTQKGARLEVESRPYRGFPRLCHRVECRQNRLPRRRQAVFLVRQ